MLETPRAVQKFVVRATEYIRGHAYDDFTIGEYSHLDEAQVAAWDFYDRYSNRDHSVVVIEYQGGIEKDWLVVRPRRAA